ncbi:hypothetical protein DFA_03015 [Cavenderia fasciculata]|uniref:C2 tensin-type domain-containing protein n=1 Tax=Cavenderia fasciculata TaxID=261658 RepID=F4PGD7_CACFS|nr:uncharacterized protein DFA_03015 [Cavenderia fasciculata]EGG24771.1 hypothetical protein DFA_03015 [Cavenderia fasciculata]|eukprot:XP_004362622.1 hypothetical protein DFA_03015 [Cavenderia fasciculata]
MQRSSIGEGVTVPSQIRYVDYINRLSTREVDISMAQQPRTLVLNRLMMRPVPRHTSGWRPTIEILNVNIPLQPVVIYSNKDSLSTPLFYSDRDPVAIIDLPPNTTLSGDILIRVYSSNEQYVSEIINSFLDKPFFRFAFHTSFINGHFIDFKKHELDESNSVMKSNIYPNDFQIRLMFSEPSQSSPPQPQQYSPQQPRQQQPPQQQQPQQQSSPQQPRQQQQQQPPQYSPQQPRQQQQQPPQPYVQSEQDNIINFNNNNNNYDSNSNNNNNGNGNGYNSNQSSPSIISQISGSYQAPNPFEQDDDL